MPRPHEVVPLIYDLVDATGDAGETMTSLADHLLADGIQALVYSPDGERVHLCMSGRVDPAADRDYVQNYHASDVRVRRALRATPWQVHDDTTFLSVEERRRSPFHQEFLPRYDCERILLATAPISDDQTFLLAIARSRRKVVFGPSTRARLLNVLPHLRRAAHLRLRAMSQAVGAPAQTLLDQQPFGCLLLNDAGAPIAVNRAARRLLAAHGIGDIRDTRLRFTHAHDARAMSRARRELAARARLSGRAEFTFISLQGNGGTPPLDALLVTGSAEPAVTLTAEAQWVLYLLEPSTAASAAQTAMMSMYGLTAAEARCAALLARGDAVAEIATKLGLSCSTIRTHVRSIFHKTHTHRQGELVARLTRGPSMFAALLGAGSEPPFS